MKTHFAHQRLEVYNLSLDFAALAHPIAQEFPPGWAPLADQFRRAMTSIILNIAEGSGEYRPLDKARFYRFAGRSAVECAAILDIAERLALASPVKIAEARVVLVRMVAMLVKLAQRHMDRSMGAGAGAGTGTGTGTGGE
jgi:four helix bundle protein